MDHLPMPLVPYNPIIIPYYETDKKFDGGNLLTFPGRCGRKVADFIATKEQFLDRRSLHELEVFLDEINSKVSGDWKREHKDVYGRLIRTVKVISKSLSSGPKESIEMVDVVAFQVARTSLENSPPRAMQDDVDAAKGSRSYFWIDHNIAQALEYLRRYLKENVEDEQAGMIAYCWKVVFQTLMFLVPALNRPGDDDDEESDEVEIPKSVTAKLEDTVLETESDSLEDIGVLSLDFCKLALETLHETFPEEVPDLATLFADIDSPAQMGFLEQWLFFGTLQKAFEAVEVPIDLERYISTDGKDPVLTTKHLTEDMQLWEAVEQNRTRGKARRQQRLTEMLVDVVMFALKISERAGSEKIADFLTAVHVLCITLEVKAARLYGGEAGALGSRNPWLGEKLKVAGWCPHQAEILLDSYVAVMVYYIYLLGPPKMPHDRENCSKWTCQLDNIQEYATLHSSMCQDGDFCAMTKLHYDDDLSESGNVYISDQEKLSAIVGTGNIPLISLGHPVFDSMVSLDIELEEYDPDSEVLYVAISHVWADGMGNPESNSLPLCQLQNLRILVRNIIGDDRARRFHLWIDTLCVPVSPPDVRKAAILQMRKIYESAAVVLVLDSELRSHPLSLDPTETLARVVNSRWARRLWTFQEAALAQNLLFQFKDQCVTMQSLYEALEPQNDLFNTWSLLEVSWWPTMRSTRSDEKALKFALNDPEVAAILSDEKKISFQTALDQMEETNTSFSVIWRAITLRTTQKPEDEVICVATLLDLDLSAILSTPVDDRRKKLLLLQRKIPSKIIFSRMRRMLDDGFRWAPKSFIGKAFLLSTYSPKGVVSEEGLSVTYPGILFRGNDVRITPEMKDYHFVFDEEPEDGVAADPKNRIPFSMFLAIERMEAFEGEEIVRDWKAFDPATYALILPQPLLTLDSRSMEGTHRYPGALVSVYDDGGEGGVMKVRYLEQVIVTRGIKREDITSSKGKTKKSAKEDVARIQDAGDEKNTLEAENSKLPVEALKKRTTWEKTFGPVAGSVPLKKTRLANPTLLSSTQRWCVG